MKSVLTAILILTGCNAAIASPVVVLTTTIPADESGFRLLDIQHPQIVTGVFTDLKGHSDAGSSLAIITYKGILDITPVGIGGSLGAGLGGPSVAIGCSANLMPEVKAGLLGVLKGIFPDPAKFANLKAILAPPAHGVPDITISAGPHISYVLYDGIKGRAMLTMFYGCAWKF